MKFQHSTRQKGSTLLVALVMLLVITLLALSGAREVALEANITGNFVEQQKLHNDAEATLREGEQQVTRGHKPFEPKCDTSIPYCLLNAKPVYEAKFEVVSERKVYSFVKNDSSDHLWYSLPTPSGADDDQSENPEYGNMLMGIGIFRYEVNAKSTHKPTSSQLQLRSNIVKIYN